MIIGIHQRPGDLKVNVCKAKALTNMRASGSDNTVKLTPPMDMSLDSMVEYIMDDEVRVQHTSSRRRQHPAHRHCKLPTKQARMIT